MNRDENQHDMLVMMRLRRISTRDARLFLFPRALLAVLIVIQELLQIVAFCLEGVPGKLLSRSWWQLPLTLLGVPSTPPLQHASTGVSALFCYLGIVVISVARARNDITEVKQWRRSSRDRTTFTHRTPFHIAVPSWLTVVDIVYGSVPSASGDQNDEKASHPPRASQAAEHQAVDSTLTYVHPTTESETEEHPPFITTAQVAALTVESSTSSCEAITASQEDVELEVAVARETMLVDTLFLIEIGQDISIFLEAAGVRIEVPLNRLYQALIVCLAVGDKGQQWVKHTQLKEVICSHRGLSRRSNVDSKEIQDAFNQAMSRIRHALQKALDQAVERISNALQYTPAQIILRMQGVEDGKPKLTDKGIVFQNELFAKNDSRWCLSPAWRVRQFERLKSAYRAIKDEQSDPSNKRIHSNTLRNMIDQVRDEYWASSRELKREKESYVGGFLVNLLSVEAFADLAPRHYEHYRKMFLSVLKHAARHEYQRGNWRRAAALYLECALAASYPPIDPEQGEQSLRECLSVYIEKDEVERAQYIYRVYERRMRKLNSRWEPDPKTVEFPRENELQGEE